MADEPTGHHDLQRAAKRLISVTEAAEIAGFTPRHVRYLIKCGAIWGQKIGRNWVTTEEAVLEYKRRGIRPGPKPRGK